MDQSGAIRQPHVFDLAHPAIQLGAFAAILVLSMSAIHPAFLIIAFAAAFTFSMYLRGWRAALRMLAWQAPMVALIALINPLFSSIGSTELFRIGTKAVYGESIAFGLCMGLMLVTVMTWFSNAAQVLSSDKVMAVLGNAAPSIALMISMSMRLVPRFVERGRHIEGTAAACSAAAADTVKEKASARIRLVSVLMGWSMEDSLETADAMRARGWGARTRRTSYQRYRFRRPDAAMAAALGLLVAATAVLAWLACSEYRFYPTMGGLAPWWFYVPYALLMFMPLLACLVDDMHWKRLA